VVAQRSETIKQLAWAEAGMLALGRVAPLSGTALLSQVCCLPNEARQWIWTPEMVRFYLVRIGKSLSIGIGTIRAMFDIAAEIDSLGACPICAEEVPSPTMLK
jgi:hypothetical protein